MCTDVKVSKCPESKIRIYPPLLPPSHPLALSADLISDLPGTLLYAAELRGRS